LAQVDAHIGTCVELASCLRATLSATVKNHEETERSYVQHGPFSKQWTSLKHSPPEKLECALAMWFKQARESIASLDGTHLKEKALHITTHLASNGWIDVFKRRHNIVYRTLSCESRNVDQETVEGWKNY
jgi:hypothetical protein